MLLTENAKQVTELLEGMDDGEVRRIGARARERVLSEHSADRRAEQFESYLASARGGRLQPAQLTSITARQLERQEERSSSTHLVAQ